MKPSHLHLARNGQEFGRYSLSHVRDCLANRTFNGEEWGWHEGLSEWKPIKSFFADEKNRAKEKKRREALRDLKSDLRELQSDDPEPRFVRRLKPEEKAAIIEKFEAIRNRGGDVGAFKVIADHFPEFLTEDGRCEVETDRGMDREMKRLAIAHIENALRSIPQALLDERPATQKQKDYLRDLGLKDEATLNALGIKQAGALLDVIVGRKS
jgi:hypothetical protein